MRKTKLNHNTIGQIIRSTPYQRNDGDNAPDLRALSGELKKAYEQLSSFLNDRKNPNQPPYNGGTNSVEEMSDSSTCESGVPGTTSGKDLKRETRGVRVSRWNAVGWEGKPSYKSNDNGVVHRMAIRKR